MFLTMKAGSGQCVSVLEVSQILSGICECAMTSAGGQRSIVNGEYHTVHFVEDVSYQVIYGVARLTREEEKVSGDNYICRQEDNGRFCHVFFRTVWDPEWKHAGKVKSWWSFWNSSWSPDFLRKPPPGW